MLWCHTVNTLVSRIDQGYHTCCTYRWMFFFLFGHLRDLIRKRFVPRKAKVVLPLCQLAVVLQLAAFAQNYHSFCRGMHQSVRTTKTFTHGACTTAYTYESVYLTVALHCVLCYHLPSNVLGSSRSCSMKHAVNVQHTVSHAAGLLEQTNIKRTRCMDRRYGALSSSRPSVSQTPKSWAQPWCHVCCVNHLCIAAKATTSSLTVQPPHTFSCCWHGRKAR